MSHIWVIPCPEIKSQVEVLDSFGKKHVLYNELRKKFDIPMENELFVPFIVIDSLTKNIRYAGNCLVESSFDYLKKVFNALYCISSNNIGVIYTNQLTKTINMGFGGGEETWYGGNISGHASSYRLRLRGPRSGSKYNLIFFEKGSIDNSIVIEYTIDKYSGNILERTVF